MKSSRRYVFPRLLIDPSVGFPPVECWRGTKAMDAPGTMSPGVSQAPTITTPAMMTGVGMFLGTAAYMSPEQARGKAVDKRSDIWAFGCVLYEMLTGRRAFGGEDVSDTLAAVLRGEPDWRLLPADTPAAVATIVASVSAEGR